MPRCSLFHCNEDMDRCPKCDGSGLIYEPKLPAIITCPHCNGAGYLCPVHDAGRKVDPSIRSNVAPC